MKETKNEFPCVIILHGNQDDPIRLKVHYETFMGILLTFIDEQGVDVENKYTIYKGRSKIPLTFLKMRDMLLPYILSWYPEMGERELTCGEQEQTMVFKAVYQILDMVQIQCNHPEQFIEGIQEAIRIGGLMFEAEMNEIFKIDGDYKPEYKKFPINRKKKENIRRYTVRPGKKRRTILTPRQIQPHRDVADEPFRKIEMVEKDGKNVIVEKTRKVKRKRKKILVNKTKGFLLVPSSSVGGKEKDKDNL